MKISMSILRQHSARNGQDGLLTQEKKLFSEVQLLNLSGESTRDGNIEVELGEVVAIPSRMMNHQLSGHLPIEQFLVCLELAL